LLYRHTVKRVRPLHQVAHWLINHSLVPWLERRRAFYTLPDDPFWFRLELLTGRHEAETAQWMRSLARPGMTVLDIGAHVGYYTRMVSGLVGPQGRVIAFEPHPRNLQALRRNTAALTNVTVLPVALAEQEGTAQLHDYLMMSASGSLHYDERMRDVQRAQISAYDIAPRVKGFQPQTYTVRTARVDDLLAAEGIDQVHLIKMDIEGAELGALRGMTATIARAERLSLIMEYNPLGLKAFGHDPEAALQEVLALGFDRLAVIERDATLTDYTHQPKALHALTQSLVQHMGVVNLLIQRG
jgi:FkbM family methyltransferase